MADPWPTNRRTTIHDLAAAKARGEKWAMLTSYDAITAAIFEEVGVRALLVGDSAAMVVHGHETTLPITLDEMIPMAAAVVRATSRCLVVGDLPFGSYHGSPVQALESAVRYAKDAGVHAVKLEGAGRVLPHVELIVSAGIPVMGHVGLTPQSVHALGGNRVQGRGDEAAARLMEDAKALEEAGAFAVVLEAVPFEVAKRVTQALKVPTVGIGAGPACDAQVLVWQDMAGLTPGRGPKFVKKYADVRGVLSAAVGKYVREVGEGTFPDETHSYR